ncbi:MAG TPA: choice-of-anchor L domain-containing protein [Planctomycetota bacterium]|jgi:hypothetical protein|nr:choice-of-anchor L domain-containing protein [Planctomycetota bacterium]
MFSSTRNSFLVFVAAAFVVSTASSPAQSRARQSPRTAQWSQQAHTPGPGGLVTHDMASGGETAASLVQALVGPGPVITNIQFTGAPIAAGTFSGGTGIIGFDGGIVLSSGNIATVLGPMNTSPGAGTDPGNGLPGDPELDAILPPSECCSWDATVLEFDMECPAGTAISLQYVFSSDEYDGVPQSIDDLFACFVNGQNIALIPGTNDPVTLQTVGPNQNSAFYITNDCHTLGLGFPCSHLATEMDGLTVVLSGTGALLPGVNHVKLAIADGGDDVVDSNVFIRAQSVACSPGVPVFEASSMCALVLDGYVGAPFRFDANAWATNGLPGAAISLDATGDAVPLAAGSFQPPLPTNPAQPGSTQFTWTPTAADLGLYHLIFTATDQVQATRSMDVAVRVSTPGMPAFDPPSPCGQSLEAVVGLPLNFTVRASAWTSDACGNGDTPGESVTLDVAGDAVPLAGGVFVPPLPAGPSQPVETHFQWTPTVADVGQYHLDFTATDRLLQSVTCGLDIRVRAQIVDVCQPGVGGVIPCPCGNPPAASPGGCDNSAATGGARLSSTGDPVIDFDTVVFTTTGETPAALSVVFQGRNLLPAGVVYGQGVRCAAGGLKRLYVKTASGGSITAPEAGETRVSTRSEQLGDWIQSGQRRSYAVYYRDPTILGGCPPLATFNITQTQEVVWHN